MTTIILFDISPKAAATPANIHQRVLFSTSALASKYQERIQKNVNSESVIWKVEKSIQNGIALSIRLAQKAISLE